MNLNNFFYDQELIRAFNASGAGLSPENIIYAIPEEFLGKENFIAFYGLKNGGYFDNQNGGVLYRKDIYDKIQDGYTKMGVESFYFISIENIQKPSRLNSIQQVRTWLAEESIEMRRFSETHIPFANDYSGNSFWIEVESGKIIFREHESDMLIEVAPSFLVFCQHIHSK